MALAELAKAEHVHILATVDHINATLLWNNVRYTSNLDYTYSDFVDLRFTNLSCTVSIFFFFLEFILFYCEVFATLISYMLTVLLYMMRLLVQPAA